MPPLHPLRWARPQARCLAELGAPTRIANLGPNTIYYYNDMKVTFTDGKVSDVQ